MSSQQTDHERVFQVVEGVTRQAMRYGSSGYLQGIAAAWLWLELRSVHRNPRGEGELGDRAFLRAIVLHEGRSLIQHSLSYAYIIILIF